MQIKQQHKLHEHDYYDSTTLIMLDVTSGRSPGHKLLADVQNAVPICCCVTSVHDETYFTRVLSTLQDGLNERLDGEARACGAGRAHRRWGTTDNVEPQATTIFTCGNMGVC
jgi:hypothetical protein